MVTILVTFVLTTALYGGLAVWGLRRLIRHLQSNNDGVKAVTEHVLLPMLGRSPEDVEKKKPAVKDTRL
jgi:hypothetical protein